MITLKELLSGADFDSLDESIQSNLYELLKRINVIRDAYGKPMTVTSGFRTMKHHLEIYKAKGITDPARIPMQSNHLYGKAVDISDTNKELQKWVTNNVSLLEHVGLWCESFLFTKTWVHFQINPPASGRRFFMP
jgi:uncharacterized protein YcbK (DUF882 family)